MYKLIRLDTGEEVVLNEYYAAFLNVSSARDVLNKHNLIINQFGKSLVRKDGEEMAVSWAASTQIIPGHLLEYIDFPDV